MNTNTRPMTMKRIAAELGLSRLTVSMVVNNRAEEHRIPPQTIQRVQDYLKQKGYVPSRHALDRKSVV
jgi:DNA-binding LacI/PurR family transcriptional regulator